MTMTSDVERYIAFKRGQGYRMVNEAHALARYANYAEASGDVFTVAERMVEWAGMGGSLATVQNRLNALRSFAVWLHSEDERHEVPPSDVGRGRKLRPAPHLLSRVEIRRLMDAALLLQPAGSIRPHTYHFMFGLMAVTGLRRSEAVRLRLDDIGADGLFVRESKFRKSRLLPLHESTRHALERYLEIRSWVATEDDHLFVVLNGKRPSGNSVTAAFAEAALAAGLRNRSERGGVRLHDLRHSFAVHALESATPTSRDGVNRHILSLSTYLGHANLASTYWYLEATPALMRQVAVAAEQRHNARGST